MNDLLTIVRQVARPGATIEADTPLISSGLVDSFRFATLVAALEAHYKMRIPLAEVGVDNFDTAAQMDRFLRARQ
jgi:acyl carrier protein